MQHCKKLKKTYLLVESASSNNTWTESETLANFNIARKDAVEGGMRGIVQLADFFLHGHSLMHPFH